MRHTSVKCAEFLNTWLWEKRIPEPKVIQYKLELFGWRRRTNLGDGRCVVVREVLSALNALYLRVCWSMDEECLRYEVAEGYTFRYETPRLWRPDCGNSARRLREIAEGLSSAALER